MIDPIKKMRWLNRAAASLVAVLFVINLINLFWSIS